MQKPLDSIALAIATLVQLGGSVGAIAALAWWAASLAAGSVLGGILLFLLSHIYLGTTGKTVGQMFKMMFTGWHEH